ncbi:Protein kinase domain and Citron-like domain and Serine/threonine-/dual specificity protein kinase, catalytic domain and Protein kinase-like domain-containing protein [Strongyloides ratti]|uniref:Mitogen-activated protein kinase kinase kinase kinase n=1 Tax=Strongyloides ratti TaxID=34506 RepID=A0A090L022_STRRB|nr:Protein kinase domain and Citron-like domain and Serine/threonine-/dual specificity protein kinase, catalytic domain and Protein kinase-like domain-containing protein [Strongyloides ratti]CEF63120.1 Protein kinase domain and Citron-like domain and Serine/threonine-/dual specificity protein kinase, catalytic domain and Protein kinase-like domain-containing protein [Strongyloides ratti]
MNNDVIRRADPTDFYNLIQTVGSGTYGEVWKAKEIKTGLITAIKVVKLEAGDNFAAIQQEIYMLKDCLHPNIIAYYNSFLKRDKLWIVMEYCSGGSLQDIYQLTGPLKEQQIAFVCRETLRGLHYLHSKRQVHRDVKSANILLTSKGDVKLADFGVAAQITETIGKRKSFIGTPYWMAPEVACVEKKGGYGNECDVWSVGITAIELAELQPPHFELHPMSVLYMMTKNNYKPPRLKEKDKWSPLFHEFIKLCLTKNPKRRPSPEKLLVTCNFVIGELSSHLTKELLDKVNNPSIYYKNEEDHMISRMSTISIRDDSTLELSNNQSINQGRSKLSFGTPKVNPTEQEIKNGYCNEKNLSSRLSQPELKEKCEDVENIQIQYSSTPKFLNRRPTAIPPPPPIDNNKCIKTLHRCVTEPSDSKNSSEFLHTPAVTMGACFVNIFHDCGYKIHCTASWINPQTKKKLLLIGAEEGIFSLDFDELHENSLKLLHKKRCVWLYVINGVLMALQGKTPYIYRHDLISLTQKNIAHKLSKTVNRIPEKFLPKALAVTVKLVETKDCLQCIIDKSPFGMENTYLCCVIPNALLLYQWYDPYKKFLMLKKIDVKKFPFLPLKPFQFLYGSTAVDSDFPKICIGVYRSKETNQFFLHTGDFNDYNENTSDTSSVNDDDVDSSCDSNRNSTLIHSSNRATLTQKNLLEINPFQLRTMEKIEVKSMKQLDSDTILLSYNNKVLFIDMNGNLKKRVQSPNTFIFTFNVEAILVLPDSFLAFHRHGVEGRSWKTGDMTQDLCDHSKFYQLIGVDDMVVLKIRQVKAPTNSDSGYCDLAILTGHVSTM